MNKANKCSIVILAFPFVYVFVYLHLVWLFSLKSCKPILQIIDKDEQKKILVCGTSTTYTHTHIYTIYERRNKTVD